MTSPVQATAWAARRRTPLTFRLETTDPDSGRLRQRTYTVPEHPARVWVYALLSSELEDLLLDALPEQDAQELWEEAADPDCDLTVELLHSIGQQLVTQVAGRPWWQAERLVYELVGGWQALDGLAADRGLGDPLDWPLERLCNWVALRLQRGASTEEERRRIDTALNTPPADTPALPSGTPRPAPDTAPGADEGSGWASLAGMFGVAGPDGAAAARIGAD